MGRRDEAQAATFAAVETMKAKVREDQKALFERLKGVPLSELTVSDMVAIVQCLTRGHKIDYHANVPGRVTSQCPRRLQSV